MNNENILKYPLNLQEIADLNPDALIITYDELNKYNNIKIIISN